MESRAKGKWSRGRLPRVHNQNDRMPFLAFFFLLYIFYNFFLSELMLVIILRLQFRHCGRDVKTWVGFLRGASKNSSSTQMGAWREIGVQFFACLRIPNICIFVCVCVCGKHFSINVREDDFEIVRFTLRPFGELWWVVILLANSWKAVSLLDCWSFAIICC